MKKDRKVPGGSLKYSKLLAAGLLGKSKKAPTEEHKRWASILRTGAIGASQAADLPYLPADIYNLVNRMRGKEDKSIQKRPSERLRDAIDIPTNNSLVPSTKLGKISDAVTRFGAEGMTGAGVIGSAAKLAKAIPYLGKTLKHTGNFMKPTKAGSVGVASGQAVLNENENNYVAAMMANLTGGYKAAKFGKAMTGIGRYKTQTDIRANHGYQKGLEQEISKRAGSERINELPKNEVGKIIQEGVGNYLGEQKEHFKLRKEQINKALDEVVAANPKLDASVSMKSVTNPLLNGFNKLKSPAEKEAYLRTPAGRMMIRIFGMPSSTDAVQFQKSMLANPNNFKNPTLNLSEADNVIHAMNDATTTFGETGKGAKQHLKKLANEVDNERLAAIERIDPKLHKEATKYKDDYATYAQDIDLINDIRKHAPKVNKRGVTTNKGDPSKVLGVVTKDLNEGARSLERTGHMLQDQAKNDATLGVIHQLGNIDNKFDISKFYDNFRGLDAHEQSKILSGLNKETRPTFNRALDQHKSYLDVKSTPNILDRIIGAKSSHPDTLHPSKTNLVVDQMMSSAKEPSKRQLRKGIDFLDRNLESKNRSSLSKWTERIAEPKVLARSAIESPTFKSPSVDEDAYIQDYVSQMSDEQLGIPPMESVPQPSNEDAYIQNYVSQMTDEQLGI